MSEVPVAVARWLMLLVAATVLSHSALGKDKNGRVYRCEIDGKTTYSDSVCEKAPDKKEVAVGSLNGGTVVSSKGTTTISVPSVAKPPAKNKSKPPPTIRSDAGATTESQADQKMRCKDISAQLGAITKRLRDGNGLRDSGESMRLSDERQRLEQESKNQKCG